MQFSDDERLVLHTICSYFHNRAKWPTYDELDRALSDNHPDLDVEVVGRNLEPFMYDGPYAPMSGWDPERSTFLNISALHTCLSEGIYPELAEDLDAFTQVMHLCIEKYRTRTTENPRITEAEVRDRYGMSDLMLRKVFELVARTDLSFGSSWGEDGPGGPVQWTITVSPYMRKYRKVATLDDFIAVRRHTGEEQQRLYQPAADAYLGVEGLISTQVTPLTMEHKDVAESDETDGLVPLDLIMGTRGYIEKVAVQVNKTYNTRCFDACAVMLRRLVETLIIEAFEAHGMDGNIKYSTGEFMQLRDLIDQTLTEKSWNLGRSVRKSLPQLKSIGDKSAHDRRYNAMRSDIDKIKDDIRAVVQELLYLAKLK